MNRMTEVVLKAIIYPQAPQLIFHHIFLLSSYCEKEIPLPLKRDRDDRLFCGTLEEEAAIRYDILFMKDLLGRIAASSSC